MMRLFDELPRELKVAKTMTGPIKGDIEGGSVHRGALTAAARDRSGYKASARAAGASQSRPEPRRLEICLICDPYDLGNNETVRACICLRIQLEGSGPVQRMTDLDPESSLSYSLTHPRLRTLQSCRRRLIRPSSPNADEPSRH